MQRIIAVIIVAAVWPLFPRPAAAEEMQFYDCRCHPPLAAWSGTAWACRMVRKSPELFDKRFHPYNAGGAAVLQTDPRADRDISAAAAAGRRETAFFAGYSDIGWHLAIYFGEPDLLSPDAEKRKQAGGSFELYFLPGDGSETPSPPYYQVFVKLPGGAVTEYPWMSPGPRYRLLGGAMKVATAELPEGAWLVTVFIPWDLLYDRMPFRTGQAVNWRFGLIRWAPGGGLTWGGDVHATGDFGYIRWEPPSPNARAAIYRRTIELVRSRYRRQLDAAGSGWQIAPADVPFEAGAAAAKRPARQSSRPTKTGPITSKLFSRSFDANERLEKRVDGIARARPEELEQLLREVGQLDNFRYTVSEARKDYLMKKLFKP